MSKLQDFKSAIQKLKVPGHYFKWFEKVPGGSKNEVIASFKNTSSRFRSFEIMFDGKTVFPQTIYKGEPLWYPIAPPVTTENGIEPALQKCLEMAKEYL